LGVEILVSLIIDFLLSSVFFVDFLLIFLTIATTLVRMDRERPK